jgi:hypothetical protein
MDDGLEEAEFLCRRYGYLDKKLRELTAAIRTALDRAARGAPRGHNRGVKKLCVKVPCRCR